MNKDPIPGLLGSFDKGLPEEVTLAHIYDGLRAIARSQRTIMKILQHRMTAVRLRPTRTLGAKRKVDPRHMTYTDMAMSVLERYRGHQLTIRQVVDDLVDDGLVEDTKLAIKRARRSLINTVERRPRSWGNVRILKRGHGVPVLLCIPGGVNKCEVFESSESG